MAAPWPARPVTRPARARTGGLPVGVTTQDTLLSLFGVRSRVTRRIAQELVRTHPAEHPAAARLAGRPPRGHGPAGPKAHDHAAAWVRQAQVDPPA